MIDDLEQQLMYTDQAQREHAYKIRLNRAQTIRQHDLFQQLKQQQRVNQYYAEMEARFGKAQPQPQPQVQPRPQSGPKPWSRVQPQPQPQPQVRPGMEDPNFRR